MSAHRYRLISLLQRTAHRLKTEADAEFLETANITMAQATALELVIQAGPLSQRTLANALSQRESAITAMVERLRKAGYVCRRRSETDRRAWLLQATDKGRDARQRLQEPLRRINAELDAAFAEVDMAAMAEGLEQTLARLEARRRVADDGGAD
jgi:DNA-binding MarR family transcriptional regulator